MSAKVMQLQSGRMLGYRTLGSPKGIPLLFFHGFPGSSVQATLVKDESVYSKFFLIAVDRPGFGESDHDSERTHLSFAQDLMELLAYLNVDAVHLLGVSGGGPYAFAAAQKFERKALSLNVVSGLGLLSAPDHLRSMHGFLRLALRLSGQSESLSIGLMSILGLIVSRRQEGSRVDKGFKIISKTLPDADRAIVANEILRAKFRESMRHSFLRGPHGSARDLYLMTRDWGVDFSKLALPIRLWHGEQDSVVPAAHSSLLRQRLPHAQLNLLPGEGHYSLPLTRLEQILAPI